MPTGTIDSAIFKDIFGTEAMRQVWSDGNRIQKYLDFEAGLARAQARLKIIPQEACDEILKHVKVEQYDIAKLKTETERIGYPVLPVVSQLVKLCKDGLGEWCHWGATTQDITDSATIMQIREGLAIIEKDINDISDALAALAKKHRNTVMAGRSNLQQAVPITFGYKCATYLAAFERHKQRLQQLKERTFVFEFGGAAGTLSSLGKDGLRTQVELAKELNLAQPEIAQITYLHIEYVGPGRVFLVAAVDLEGDTPEHTVAARLNAIEDELARSPRVAWAVLTLSRPGAPALDPQHPADPLMG